MSAYILHLIFTWKNDYWYLPSKLTMIDEGALISLSPLPNLRGTESPIEPKTLFKYLHKRPPKSAYTP